VLWTSEWNAGQVYAVYVDERDDVWLSDFGANALVRFDPNTETFAVVPLPDANAQVRQMLGRPGEVWGAESGADALVVVRSICG
jgi:virginiamycin B lyase